jgi:hypothetical protein
MNYILKKIEVNGSADMYGGSDYETEIALSDSVDKLQEYCKENYGYEASVGKPQNFEWVYFKIVETNLIVI